MRGWNSESKKVAKPLSADDLKLAVACLAEWTKIEPRIMTEAIENNDPTHPAREYQKMVNDYVVNI